MAIDYDGKCDNELDVGSLGCQALIYHSKRKNLNNEARFSALVEIVERMVNRNATRESP